MAQKTYTVTFPDGHVQEFSSVEGLSENDAIDRAIQERSIAEGKTATTYGGGVKQDLASEAKGFAAGLNPASLILGLPRALTETLATARAKATDSALPFEQQAAGVQTTIDESKKPHPAEPGQSGQMLGSLLLGTLLGNVVPKGVKAAVNSPTGKAVGAVAHDLPVVGKTIKAFGKGAEAYREASKPAPPEILPIADQVASDPATGTIPNAATYRQPYGYFDLGEFAPKSIPVQSGVRMAGKAPALETVLDDLLNEIRKSGPDSAELSMAPPSEIQLTPGGQPPIGNQTPSTVPREAMFSKGGTPMGMEDLLKLIESLRQGRH